MVVASNLLFNYSCIMEDIDAVSSLAALAHEVRLRVFRLLVVAGRTGLTPGAITEACGIPATSLSFHLKELTRAGLIRFERSGRHLIYHAAFDHMNALLGYLTANCCRGEACVEPVATVCC
jgi:ArsR family transcriptional regulator